MFWITLKVTEDAGPNAAEAAANQQTSELNEVPWAMHYKATGLN